MARLAVLLALVTVVIASAHGFARKRLANYLRSQSDPGVLPPATLPISVRFMSQMLNVADVDEKRNVVEMEILGFMFWESGLTWNPADYEGIQAITMPARHFWHPPAHTVSTAVQQEDLSPQLVKLYHNGTMTKAGLFRPRMLCDVADIATTGANCSGRGTVWGYNMDEVVMVPMPVPQEIVMRDYFAGSKYNIIGGGMTITEFSYDGHTHQVFHMNMVIKEKPHTHHGHGPFRAVFQFGH